MAANAPKSVKMRIVEVLSDLTENDLKKFVHHLRERKQEPRIRINDVEKKDRLDIADLLVFSFAEEEALRVALQTLELAGFKKQAEELAGIL